MRLEDKLRLAARLTGAAFALLCAMILTGCARWTLPDLPATRASDLLAPPAIPSVPGPEATQQDLFDAYAGTLAAARVCYQSLGKDQGR